MSCSLCSVRLVFHCVRRVNQRFSGGVYDEGEVHDHCRAVCFRKPVDEAIAVALLILNRLRRRYRLSRYDDGNIVLEPTWLNKA